MTRREKRPKKAKKTLDAFSPKRGRGRPGVRASEIGGRSYDYRLKLSHIWDDVRDSLLKAKTEEDVIRAFDQRPIYQRVFAEIASLILKVLKDPKFPKRPGPQRNFLADSLAGRGSVTPRRSRDICGQERRKDRERARFKILRWEFYIVCSCKYKGPALNHACPKCGSEVPISSKFLGNTSLFWPST
jgi:hypothetical protein